VQQAHVYPVKVRHHDADIGVDVIRIVAYRGACPCGWRSASRETYSLARRETLQHKREAHGHKPR
jgi:hypothetical protein